MFNPTTFDEFIGQEHIKMELQAMLKANRNDSVLIRGGWGSGKTTLAKIYAYERGFYSYQQTPVVIPCTNTKAKTHVVDEIHLAKSFEELYDEMTKVTYVFCTTEMSVLPQPFVSRCVPLTMSDYSEENLQTILGQKAKNEKLEVSTNTLKIIASRSRLKPRTAIQLLERVLMLCNYKNIKVTPRTTSYILDELRVYDLGLMDDDILYLKSLESAKGNAVSLFSLCATLNRDQNYVRESIESFLLRKNFVLITPRGRVLTDKGQSLIKTLEI